MNIFNNWLCLYNNIRVLHFLLRSFPFLHGELAIFLCGEMPVCVHVNGALLAVCVLLSVRVGCRFEVCWACMGKVRCVRGVVGCRLLFSCPCHAHGARCGDAPEMTYYLITARQCWFFNYKCAYGWILRLTGRDYKSLPALAKNDSPDRFYGANAPPRRARDDVRSGSRLP